MKRRYIASILALVMTLTVLAPSAALARPRYHRHHHHHSRYLWGLGLGLVGGYMLHNNTNQPVASRIAVYDYNMYKQDFVNDLNDAESAVYVELSELEPNEDGRCYRLPYDKGSTKRHIQKITQKLYEDFQYIGVKEDFIYFKKLK